MLALSKIDRLPLELVLPREKPKKTHEPVIDAAKTTTFFHRARSLFTEVGDLKYLSGEDALRDNSGKCLPCNFSIEVTDVHQACQIARKLNMGIVMIGALTSATNNFGPNNTDYKGLRGIIAIKPIGIINEDNLKSTPEETQTPNASNQIRISQNALGKDKHTITVGAGLTFAQVNEVIAHELGSNFFVPVDLTTVNQALAGAVFSTGAMGPSRIRMHEIVHRVNITDGQTVKALHGDEVEKHEGLIGLTGAVTEIELRIYERPKHRFGITIPLQNVPEVANGKSNYVSKASKVLSKLTPYQQLDFSDLKMKSEWQDGYVDGIEIITIEDLRLIEKHCLTPEIRKEAKRLIGELEEANSSYMLYVTGNADKTISEQADENNNLVATLFELMDEETIGVPTPLEETSKLETMRKLRESIPDLAREQGRIKEAANGVRFSTSTDINTTINPQLLPHLSPDELAECFHRILQPYLEYEAKIRDLANQYANTGIDIDVYRYGHLQPRNIDPHVRAVAKSAEDTPEFRQVIATIQEFKKTLMYQLESLPDKDPRISTTHGEKGKITSFQLLTPEAQGTSRAEIDKAGIHWNFRAPRSINAPISIAA